jgi:hypothetical protein
MSVSRDRLGAGVSGPSLAVAWRIVEFHDDREPSLPTTSYVA